MLLALYKQIQKNYIAKTSISDDINTQKSLKFEFRRELLSSYTLPGVGYLNQLQEWGGASKTPPISFGKI